MKLIIEIKEQNDDFIGQTNTATLVGILDANTGWTSNLLLDTDSENCFDEFEAVHSLMDELEKNFASKSTRDEDEIKLARWNNNVMDWQHIRAKYQPKELAAA